MKMATPAVSVNPFDPFAESNILLSINRAMLLTEPVQLSALAPFTGAGVYALYYAGALPLYAPIATPENLWPLYIGKADAAGARKGVVDTATVNDKRLYRRLKDHAKSISDAENLDLEDFWFLALPLKEVFTSMAERMMIGKYRPVWNAVTDGFGNHNQGSTRKTQEQSHWDLLHPGRPWAARPVTANRRSYDEAEAAVAAHFADQFRGTSAARYPSPRTFR